jgi:chemotaxis protein MotB
MARRKEAHGGGHGWFVTFADLMGLLVSFFVMLVAFSNQDAKKVQAVAGSMREAFGVQQSERYSGLDESEGLPTRSSLKNAAHIQPMDSSVTPTPNKHGSSVTGAQVSSLASDRAFALAAESLRQALHDLPELTEASKHIMVEETKEGINIEVVDQDGSSMFPEGSKEPYERTRKLFQKIAEPLKATPYRISIIGHTAGAEASPQPDYGAWNLSVDRASIVRQILEEQGYPTVNIYKVVGRAGTDPLFPDDVSSAPNRRVTITLMREASPVPPDLRP